MALYLVVAVIALVTAFLGYLRGISVGTKVGLKVGKDMEFYLFAKSLDKLRIQTKYTNILEDIKIQYASEQNNLFQDIENQRK